MHIINISVKNKIAAADEMAVYVCGNSDYVIKFTFDEEWNSYNTKTARFVNGSSYTDVVFTGDQCSIPVIEDADSLLIGVYAGNLSTSTPALIGIKKSVRSGTGSPVAPTPAVYDQVMEVVNGAIDEIENMTFTASVDSNVGTPSVTVTKTVEDDHINLDLDFKNLKGRDGTNGTNGRVTDIKISGSSIVGDDGSATIPIATSSSVGLMYAGASNSSGIYTYSDGRIQIDGANDSLIENRSTTSRPITPSHLAYAVKSAMSSTTDASWSDTEKKNARQRMGENDALNLVYDQTHNFTEENVLQIDFERPYEEIDVRIWLYSGSCTNWGTSSLKAENGIWYNCIEFGNVTNASNYVAGVYYKKNRMCEYYRLISGGGSSQRFVRGNCLKEVSDTLMYGDAYGLKLAPIKGELRVRIYAK